MSHLKRQVIGHEKTASGCTRGGLDRESGIISSWKGWFGIGTGCPGRWGSLRPWRYLKAVALRAVVRGWHSVGHADGRDDLEYHFQPG